MNRDGERTPLPPTGSTGSLERTDNPGYDVWLGVGLRVEAASPGEAMEQAIAWLTASLKNAPPQDGLQVTAPAMDLAEPVVRAIHQIGNEKRAMQLAESAEAVPVGAQGDSGANGRGDVGEATPG
jgi:hypothetical protein